MSKQYFISMGPLGHITEAKCHMTILRGHTQFSITVEFARIKGTSLGKTLLQNMEIWKTCPWTRANDMLLFSHIYQHCLPLIEKLAPQMTLEDLSLESFLHSPTYNLALIQDGVGDEIHIKGEDACLYTPAFAMTPMHTTDLPQLCDTIPFLHARDIQIAQMISDGQPLDTLQGKVVTIAGETFYFKPCIDMREQEFERELCILSRITQTGLATRLHVPALRGIVVSGEHQQIAMGILITYISGSHLRTPALQRRSDLHAKWEQQVSHIVKELHAKSIVWGDVHPMNIVIDEAMDAWAVDFGGRNNVAFVDNEKAETEDRDWQGVRRVFGVWLADPEMWETM
ncbi:uncharacterized protein yc1106_04676 [Curvularia clavata]|uniref:Protein kinase domain-containing protein n=1 Tax=Curvularia clavata TaxID=95742 RepID=A0A9Q8Z899_CURCL|nr:uncharacterized protein yc1106_04676 [Curvularia clavata]